MTMKLGTGKKIKEIKLYVLLCRIYNVLYTIIADKHIL